MLRVAVLVAMMALLGVPGALAMEEVVFSAPDVNLGVEGRTVRVDSAEHVRQSPAAVTAEVEVHDVDLSVRGLRCALDPDLEGAKGKGETATEICQAEAVTTPDAARLVEADVGLLLPEAATEEGSSDEGVETESAEVVTFAASPTKLLAVAAATGVSLAGLYGVWRLLKWTGLAAFIPLYSHIRDDEILDDPNRAGIYRLIQEEPGVSTKDIADRLDLAWGTVTHHLGKLEKRRFVVSKKYGKYRRYFANGAGGTDEKDAVAVLRLDRTGDVAALIRANPGMTQKAVSTALGVSSSTILWHVKRLEEVHLVTKVREGKIVRYYPGAGMGKVDIISPAAMTTAA